MVGCRAVFALLVALCLLAPAASAQRRELVDPGAASPPATAARVPDSLRQWIEGLPPDQRRVAVRRLRSMPPAGRQRFFRRWEAASPAEREQFTARMQNRAQRMLERQRGGSTAEPRGEPRRDAPGDGRVDPRFEGNRQAWESMRPGQRERMRRRLERFGGLSAPEQEAMVERHFADRTPAERARILERLRSSAGRLPER